MSRTFSTEKVSMTDRYLHLIRHLHDDKIEINNEKIARYGSINIDDHGYILFPDFHFEPEKDENGKITGCYMIGKNFGRLLREMPRYINRSSALAVCWTNVLFPIDIPPEDTPGQAWEETVRKYRILQTGFVGMNHLCPDLNIGLELGWKGLLDRVRFYRTRNRPADTGFYDGEEQLLLGILDWIKGHAELAEKLADEETDPFYQQNYRRIAGMNRNLLTRPPQDFREACQFLAQFQSVDRMYFAGGALNPLDVMLEPYFEKDIADGKLTEEEAVWYLASLFFNDTHYTQLGGLTPAGDREVTSRLSFVILDAMHLLKIPNNVGIRVHAPIPGQNEEPEKLLKRAVEYTMEDGFGVCYSLDKGITEGYARNGYPLELGRMRTKCGCNWVAVPGREYPLQDVTRCNMAMALHYALEDLKAEKEYSMERLWDLFCHHLSVMVDVIKEGYDKHYEIVGKDKPEIVLNLFMHGPIERGLNCSNGGVDILNLNMDGIALATVADSFAAVQQRVVEEKKMTWERLFELLDTDYQDAENERLMLHNIQRFGTPGSEAEAWALRIRDEYVHLVRDTPTPKHHLLTIPGMFSHGDVYMYGNVTPATPNGRHNGDPISHSTEPDPGFARGLDTFSPALKANAVAMTQAGYGNSAPLQVDVDTGLIEGVGGVDALVALIHAHEQMGGTLINMNCLSKETLLEAHADPSTHPDLVVRVTGYSAFFASLSQQYRQQIVDRFLDT